VTYPEVRFHAPTDHFLIKCPIATNYVAYRGWQTPYPQKRQQTLGATSAALWKTSESREFSMFADAFSGENVNLINFQPKSYRARFIRLTAASEHLIHRSANRDRGQVLVPTRSYPRKKAWKKP
jgi:hypothetical protein